MMGFPDILAVASQQRMGAPPPTGVLITDSINSDGTTVVDNGRGVFTITKTEVTGWNNSAAVSALLVGDFTLRLRALTPLVEIMVGMSTNPNFGDYYADINYGFNVYGGVAYPTHGGTNVAASATAATSEDNFWIIRRGTAITYYKGALLTTATLLYTELAGDSSDLGFLFSGYDHSSQVEAYLLNV